jgi:multidrug efflux pump subunit AcrA (membrane-fusion protein)
VVRTIVFPALRLLLWAVIAVALCVLAFRGGTGGAGPTGPGAPPLDLASPTVPVARGAVTNTVTVQGTVVADSAVPIKATAAGTVRRVLVQAGQPVAAGQGILEIRSEEERPPVTGTDSEGNPTSTPQAPRVRTLTVTAPSAGTLTTLDALVDQVVAVGDKVGAISPGTLSVTAPLTQAEQFRLLAPPSTAEVTVQGGPAPFTCTGLTLGAGAGESTGDGASAGGGGPPPGQPAATGGTTARCQVPAEVTVFAGMGASVAVQAGTAEGVLVVPVTAVQGSIKQGNVWVVGDDGQPVERPVTLGLTDGDQIEVREGVDEGEQVLQFVPVPDDTVETPGMGGPNG